MVTLHNGQFGEDNSSKTVDGESARSIVRRLIQLMYCLEWADSAHQLNKTCLKIDDKDYTYADGIKVFTNMTQRLDTTYTYQPMMLRLANELWKEYKDYEPPF